ncbi:ADP-ribose 1''-phosphate phosphatase [Lasiosphaeris hirsuta]|uniref:ADP-ribose 1''-phosphate phosphatase n=1 Tax=Lasiosphaeris hirsuta TaxID=260670 RepID=A0AA39ZWV0_9PEZI|nr:ADP-ribose 1''-phosphate phosphatase [Lasiosphaeris hirsuta]
MSSQGTFRITDKVGDLFDAPPNSVLIHACNCIGSWSGGIARAFRDHYPDAYRIYNAHCKRSLPERLAGTALLIAPRPDAGKQHYIGCVFTSKRFGRAKDTPAMILRSTAPAMLDLMRQVAAEMENGEEIGEIRMCRINSGLFSVPWQQSKRVIERLQLGEEDVPKDVELPWEIVTYNPE